MEPEEIDDFNFKDGFFLKMPEDQEKKDQIAKILSEIPLAYRAPDEFGFEDVICEECAFEVLNEKIDDFNGKLGFDWCGKRTDGDPDGAEEPFYVIWGLDLTINQVEEIQKIIAVGDSVWIEEWLEDDYHGEPCVYTCSKCEEFCVSVDATEMLAGINEGEIPDE